MPIRSTHFSVFEFILSLMFYHGQDKNKPSAYLFVFRDVFSFISLLMFFKFYRLNTKNDVMILWRLQDCRIFQLKRNKKVPNINKLNCYDLYLVNFNTKSSMHFCILMYTLYIRFYEREWSTRCKHISSIDWQHLKKKSSSSCVLSCIFHAIFLTLR